MRIIIKVLFLLIIIKSAPVSKTAFTLTGIKKLHPVGMIKTKKLPKMYKKMIKQEIKTNQYISLLIGNDEYGFEKKHIVMYDLVKDFNIENELKRKLKSLKTDIVYTKVDSIDLSDDTGETTSSESKSNSGVVLEIGRYTLKTETFSTSIIRLRIK